MMTPQRAAGTTYYYRVIASNTVGDTFDYTVQNPAAQGFQTVTVNSDPSNIVSTGDSLGDVHTAVQGDNGVIYHESYDVTSTTWSGWAPLPNGATIDTPAISVVGAIEYFVVRGSDSNLWFASRNLADGITTSWTALAGSTPKAPSLANDGNRLILSVTGSDNRIYYRIYDIATQTWQNWNQIPSGETSEKPTVAFLGNKLHFVVRGITIGSSALYSGTVNLADNSFSGWSAMAGSTPSAPVLTTLHTTNELILAVRGDDNIVYINRYNGIIWQGWTAIPSGSTPTAPAIAVYENTLHIVVTGMDGSTLWYNSLNTSTSTMGTWIPMAGSSPSAPTMTR